MVSEPARDPEDPALEDLERSPEFVASQLRVGDVLEERHVTAIQNLLSILDIKEGQQTDWHAMGRAQALMEVGGRDLVDAVRLRDEARIQSIVRKHMDRIFPNRYKVQ